jgi:translocator protein
MSSTRLGESRRDSLTEESSNFQVDYEALLKYHAAIAIQCTIISVVFLGIDTIVDTMGISNSIPSWATIPFFYGISLKSRVFNPLNNARPSLIDAVPSDGPMTSSPTTPSRRGFGDRVMPSWTPPGPVFPIMWLLVIGPLRAYSTSLVWETNGHHAFDPAIMTLIFHLAVGDVWNTMNNTERRYGAAVTGVLCVTASALLAAYRYAMVDSTAGHLLGLPMIWFAVASSLVAATWQLNPIDDKSPSKTLDPLYPVVGEISTKFLWEK